VLIRLGRPSERRRTALFNLAQDATHRPAILVVVNPPIPLQEAELQQVAEFVRGGGAVVAAGRGGGITRCVGWRIQPEGFRDDSVTVRPPLPGSGLHLPRAARVLVPSKRKAVKPEGLKQFVKESVEGDPCSTLVPVGFDTLLAAADSRPVILRLRYRGGGTITLAADPGWFTNAVWRDTEVPTVVLPLLTSSPQRPGRVAWDEYHQGFGERGGQSLAGRTWSWLRDEPAGWAVLQLIAVALVWLAVTAVRFGPARAVIERRRRSPLEHLEALAAGLESATAADTAVQRLVAGLRRRLNRSGQLSGGDVQPWLASLELAMREPRGRAAVRRLRRLIIERNSSGGRVLAAAQAVEDVWEELRPRKTRDAL
jgi:hypothetical protein